MGVKISRSRSRCWNLMIRISHLAFLDNSSPPLPPWWLELILTNGPWTILILKSYCNNTNNNCHNKLTTITITQQQQEVGVLILLILGFEQLSAAPPAVFDDYFEQDVKVAASLDFVHVLWQIWPQWCFRRSTSHRGGWSRPVFQKTNGHNFWQSNTWIMSWWGSFKTVLF